MHNCGIDITNVVLLCYDECANVMFLLLLKSLQISSASRCSFTTHVTVYDGIFFILCLNVNGIFFFTAYSLN